VAFERIPADETLDEPHRVDAMIARLRELGVVTGAGRCDHERFEALRAAVRSAFQIPWTSITPPMERLLYALAASQQAATVVCVGIFCGNTLVWNVGAACGPGKSYDAARLVGVEIDPKSVAMAAENFARIGAREAVEILAEDGHETLDRIEGPIDLLYLDANGPLPGTTAPSTKRIYLSLLERAYRKLPRGALVVAHDTLPAWFAKDAGVYLDFVRSSQKFRLSVSLEPDAEGLEVSVR
jgi:predicted O-methyltransferase YrrM